MGLFLDKPKTEKHTESGSDNGIKYALSCMQGWRTEMEDAHCVVTSLPGRFSNWSFFAVFDGHAGAAVSARCSTLLLETILQSEPFSNTPPEVEPSTEEISLSLRESFLKLDEELRRSPDVEKGIDKSGSTAVCVLISPQHYFFINCGDSRALLIRDNNVFFSTYDHKPSNPIERDRIINAGGTVMIQRVNGTLAVSRSLGDFDYKKVEGRGPTEQLVSAEPEINVIERDPNLDETIVLACDGIWDVKTNEELLAYIKHRMTVHDDITRLCNEVLDSCFFKGSRDNMSIIVLNLDAAQKVDPEVAELDRKLDEEIVHNTRDFLKRFPPGTRDVVSIITHINSLNLKNYPPGGICTKRHLIEAEYNEYMKSMEKENQLVVDGFNNKE